MSIKKMIVVGLSVMFIFQLSAIKLPSEAVLQKMFTKRGLNYFDKKTETIKALADQDYNSEVLAWEINHRLDEFCAAESDPLAQEIARKGIEGDEMSLSQAMMAKALKADMKHQIRLGVVMGHVGSGCPKICAKL